MTKSGEDYLNMTLTVAEVVDEFESQWTTNAPFTSLHNELIANNNSLTDLQSEQDKKTDGITDDKKKKRGLLEIDNAVVSGILSYYGCSIGNSDLQSSMHFAPSNFTKFTDIKMVGVSKLIQDAAAEHAKDAAPYGLTPEMIANQSTHYADYVAVLRAPRVAITATTDATEQIADMLDKQHTLIDDRFDKAMMQWYNTDFYRRVQKARIIVNSPTHHLAMTGNFTDTAGAPLQNVKVTIVNDTEKLFRKSSPLGNIRVQNLPDGEHTMTVEKPGFTTQVITFIIASPETLKVSVVMK